MTSGLNPMSLVNISAEVTRHVDSLQDVCKALSEVWQSMRYRDYDAASLSWYRETTVLRFVTVISGGAFYVSGTITVAGPRYPTLVAKFEREFVSATLPSISDEWAGPKAMREAVAQGWRP